MGVVEFPNEAFVQQAIEAYFIDRGFQIDDGGYIDSEVGTVVPVVCHETSVAGLMDAG